MPELPEVVNLCRQMADEIIGKQVDHAEIFQSKCLNVSTNDFCSAVTGKLIEAVYSKGKWIVLELKSHSILIHLGMGGDVIYFPAAVDLPRKYQFRIEFTDRSGFTIRFWWIGKIHLINGNDLYIHPQIKQIGISPLDPNFSLQCLDKLLYRKKGKIKPFLLDQKYISGIGNVYVHEILFASQLHPDRQISSISEKERSGLFHSIVNILQKAINLGGLIYEKNFYKQTGKYSLAEMAVGYKEGHPCPACGTAIIKIKTGGTSSYICPKCQIL